MNNRPFLNTVFGISIGGIVVLAIMLVGTTNSLRVDIEAVKEGQVYANSITKEKLDDSVFTSVELEMEDGTIVQTQLLKGTIKNGQLTDTLEFLAEDGTTIEAKVVSGSIFNISDGAIVIPDGSITEEQLSTIVVEKISAGLDEPTLGITDGSILTAKLADSAVTTEKLANGSVSTIKLLDGSVTSGKLTDGVVLTQHLATSSVTSFKIADNAITTSKILDNIITGAKITDSAITSPKLADNSVTTDKITNSTITDIDISASAAIAWSKISMIGSSLSDIATRSADALNITDTADYFTSTEVEGALQEIGSDISALTGGNMYVQNGNAFGSTAILGTTDNNSLQLVTNNTAKMTILSGGNVGIGTAVPTAKLHVYTDSTGVTATNYTGYLENLSTNTTTDAINKYGMYITSTGSFTGGAGTATNNYGLYVNTPTGADNNYAAVFAGGNVGIGTTSPTYGLDVEISTGAMNAKFGSTAPIYLGGAEPTIGLNLYYNSGWKFGKGSSSSYGGVIYTTVSNGNMHFLTTNSGNAGAAATVSERMIILQGGNIGVGTATPVALLHISKAIVGASVPTSTGLIVSGNNSTTSRIMSTNGNKVVYFSAENGAGIAELSTYDYGTSTAFDFIFNSNGGNVGIGVTPLAKLHARTAATAVTTTSYNGYFENLSTNTTTDGINKYGLYITSTGTFTGSTGTATNNYGLYVNTPTGGDNNFSAVFAGGIVSITGRAGGLGIGLTPAAGQKMRIYQGRTDPTEGGNGLGIEIDNTHTTSSGFVHSAFTALSKGSSAITTTLYEIDGFVGGATVKGTNAGTISNVNALVASTRLESGATGAVASMNGILLQANSGGANTTAITTLRGLYLLSPSLNGATVTNAYGIQLGDISVGSSLNYSIYTGTGAVSFGDSLTVRSGNLTLTSGTLSAAGITSSGTITFSDVTGCATGIVSNGSGVLSCLSSDRDLKENITALDSPLAKVLGLQGVSYTWKDKERLGTQTEIGLIAQDVEQVVPELVFTMGDGYKGVKYQQLTGLLVEAIKEQQGEIEQLKTLAGLSGGAELLTTDNIAEYFANTEIPNFKVQNITVSTKLIAESVEFMGDSTFYGVAKFKDTVSFGGNNAGKAIITRDTTAVTVTFTTPYTGVPVVTVTPVDNGSSIEYMVKNITETGFDIEMGGSIEVDTVFNWIAVGVE